MRETFSTGGNSSLPLRREELKPGYLRDQSGWLMCVLWNEWTQEGGTPWPGPRMGTTVPVLGHPSKSTGRLANFFQPRGEKG